MSSGHRRASLRPLLWSILVCAAPLLFLAIDLYKNRHNMATGLSLRTMAARMMLDGKQLYEDFWDGTQPILLEIIKILSWVNNNTRVPDMDQHLLSRLFGTLPVEQFYFPDVFIPFCIWFWLSGVIVLTALVAAFGLRSKTHNQSVAKILIPYFGALSITSFIVRFDFGDVQYLLLLGLFPWIMLRWLRYQKVSMPKWLALVVGLNAGLCACFDIPYLVIFLLIELALLVYDRRFAALNAPEVYVFLSVFSLNAIVLLMLGEPFKTGYWRWTVPFKLFNYANFNYTIFAPDNCPNRADVLYCMTAAALLSMLFFGRNSLVCLINVLMFAGFGLYYMEGEGFSHDLILTIFGASFVFAFLLYSIITLTFLLATGRNYEKTALASNVCMLILSLIASGLVMVSLERDRDLRDPTKWKLELKTIEEALVDYNSLGEPVAIICEYPEASYPALLFLNCRTSSFLLNGKPLRTFSNLNEEGRLKGPMKEFWEVVEDKMRDEIDFKKPRLVLISMNLLDEPPGNKIARTIIEMFGEYERLIDTRYATADNHRPHEFIGHNFAFQTYRRIDKKN